MTYDEFVKVYLWRQRNVSGVFLCYKVWGAVPVGLCSGGSRIFDTDAAIDQVLIEAKIAPSIVGEDERAANIFGVAFSKLVWLGLDPAKQKG